MENKKAKVAVIINFCPNQDKQPVFKLNKKNPTKLKIKIKKITVNRIANNLELLLGKKMKMILIT